MYPLVFFIMFLGVSIFLISKFVYGSKDCKLSLWKYDGEGCVKIEGKWKKKKIREILENPSEYGKKCGSLEGYDDCSQADCPYGYTFGFDGSDVMCTKNQNCELSDWKIVDNVCKRDSDGVWKKKLGREIIKEPSGLGSTCGDIVSYINCTKEDCPEGDYSFNFEGSDKMCTPNQDCVLSEWEYTGSCRQIDGVWKKKKERTVITQPTGMGKKCDALEGYDVCSLKDCPEGDYSFAFEKNKMCTPNQDCVLSEWKYTGGCKKIDGVWKKKKERTVITQPTGMGKKCDSLEGYDDCSLEDCPKGDYSFNIKEGEMCTPNQDCVLSEWKYANSCYLKNGVFVKNKNRDIVTYPVGTGKRCDSLYGTEECSIKDCPDDGEYRFNKNGDKMCEKIIDCVISDDWKFTECFKKNGKYVKHGNKQILQKPNNIGKACGPIFKTEDCSSSDCPTNHKFNLTGDQMCEINRNCVTSDWVKDKNCQLKDGKWQRRKTRKIEQEQSGYGTPCGNLEEFEECTENDCDKNVLPEGGYKYKFNKNKEPMCEIYRDCILSDWKEDGECQKIDGVWKKKLVKSFIQRPFGSGEKCGEMEKTQECTVKDCPDDGGEYYFNKTGSKMCSGYDVTVKINSYVTPRKHPYDPNRHYETMHNAHYAHTAKTHIYKPQILKLSEGYSSDIEVEFWISGVYSGYPDSSFLDVWTTGNKKYDDYVSFLKGQGFYKVNNYPHELPKAHGYYYNRFQSIIVVTIIKNLRTKKYFAKRTNAFSTFNDKADNGVFWHRGFDGHYDIRLYRLYGLNEIGIYKYSGNFTQPI